MLPLIHETLKETAPSPSILQTIGHNQFLNCTLFLCSTAESCLPSKPRLLLPLWLMGMMPWVRSICLGRKRKAPRPTARHSCHCTACSTEKPPTNCSRSAAYHQRATGTAWCQPSSAWWDIHTQLQKQTFKRAHAGYPLMPNISNVWHIFTKTPFWQIILKSYWFELHVTGDSKWFA